MSYTIYVTEMILVGLFASAFSVTFSGGSDHSLVEWIRQKTGKDCAVVFDPDRTWSAFTVRSDDDAISIQEIADHSSIRFSTDSTNSDAVAIHLDWWPVYAFAHNRYEDRRELAEIQLEPTEVPLRPFSTAPGKVVACKELTTLYRARFAYNWFFEKSRIALSCRDSDRESVLPAVALALGAVVKRRGQMWTFEPDYAVLRERVIGFEKLRQKSKANVGSWYHQLDLTAEVYRQMSVLEVKDLYANHSKTREFLSPRDSRLFELGRARLAATYSPTSPEPSTRALGETLASKIDWNKGLGVYVRPGCLVSSYLTFKDEHISKGGAVRIVL